MMLYYNGDLQANGFRSMLRVVNTLVRHCSDIMETVRHQLATLGYVAPEVMMIMMMFMMWFGKGEDVQMWLGEGVGHHRHHHCRRRRHLPHHHHHHDWR